MGDPELVARAQQAAVRLERSWDRWRRMHGLAAEQAQPVSSYVGYSLAEPWGRPRVVFGVGAEEAERLSQLLEQDEGADPRYNQGLLWEPESPAQPPRIREHPASGTYRHEPAPHRAGQAGQQPRPAEQAPGEWAPGRLAAQRAAAADRTGSAESGDAGILSADLAGWTSGELPGQASAGLAAGQAPAATGHPGAGADLPEAGSGAAEPAAWPRLT